MCCRELNLRIELYFRQICKVIEFCLVIQSSNVAYDKRATYEGFIHGKLYFADGSVLSLHKFVDAEIAADRLMYVYHYMNAVKTLLFRYDNTGHHRKLELSTSLTTNTMDIRIILLQQFPFWKLCRR